MQTIESGRSFLQDNRALVVAIYKRQARIGGVSFDDAGLSIEELANIFTLLVAMTDFVNVSRNPIQGVARLTSLIRSTRSDMIPKWRVRKDLHKT